MYNLWKMHVSGCTFLTLNTKAAQKHLYPSPTSSVRIICIQHPATKGVVSVQLLDWIQGLLAKENVSTIPADSNHV